MKMKALKIQLLAGGILAAAAWSPAMAQDTAGNDTDAATAPTDEAFGTIVVTAQKREQALNDVPVSVSAFNGETLDRLQVEDATDLARIVPGLKFTAIGFGPPIYNLRGVGFKDTSYNAASTVGIYVDEAAIPYPIMSLGATLDLERVEVLKGPQGTLYGRNNTGGAINYIAGKPKDDFEAKLSLGASSFSRFDVEGMVTGPISDNVRVRLASTLTKSYKGWQINPVTGSRLGKLDKFATRLSIDADLSPTTSALLQFSYWSDNSEVPAAQAIKAGFQSGGNAPIVAILQPWINRFAVPGETSNRIAGWSDGQDLRNNMSSLSANLRLQQELSPDIDLTSITAYSVFRDDGGRRDIGSFAVPYADATRFVSLYASPQDWPWLPNLLLENQAKINAFSQELRLSGQSGSLNWVAGGYFAKDKVDSEVLQEVLLTTNTNNFGPLTNPADPASRRFNIRSALQDGLNRSRTIGFFGQADYSVTDTIRVTTGLRFSNDKQNYTYCARDSDNLFYRAFAGAVPGGCLTLLANGTRGQYVDKLKENSVSGRLAIDYKPNNDVLIYGSYNRGYKAGSFPNQLAFFFPQVAPAVQERLDSFEVGAKLTLLDGAVQFNNAVFYNKYKDKQVIGVVIDPVFGALRRLVNIPNSEIKGLETELQVRPVDGLFMSVGASFIDTKIKGDFIGPNAFGTQINYGGSRFTDAAKFQATGLFNYDVSLSGGLDAFIGGDFNYSSRVNYDFEPGRVVTGVAATAPTALDPSFIGKSYVVLGARAGFKDPDDAWRVTFWARNLTNEVQNLGVRKVLDAVARYTAMPRTFGVTVDFAIGR